MAQLKKSKLLEHFKWTRSTTDHLCPGTFAVFFGRFCRLFRRHSHPGIPCFAETHTRGSNYSTHPVRASNISLGPAVSIPVPNNVSLQRLQNRANAHLQTSRDAAGDQQAEQAVKATDLFCFVISSSIAQRTSGSSREQHTARALKNSGVIMSTGVDN